MRVRVVCCDDESHDLPWVLAAECSHWSMHCPASTQKKAKHKLRRSESRGFAVLVNGVGSYGGEEMWWPYPGDPTPGALKLVEKWYEGHWCPGPEYGHDVRHCGVPPGVSKVDKAGLGSIFVQGTQSMLLDCANECGFQASL